MALTRATEPDSDTLTRAAVVAYVGGYTRSAAAGIFAARGAVGTLVVSREVIEHPSFLAQHPSYPILYALSEVMDAGAGAGGAITAFKIERDGRLVAAHTVHTIGGAPVYLSLSRRAQALLFVNYCGDHAGWVPLGDDGLPCGDARVVAQPGSAAGTGRQDAPHPHCIIEQPGQGRVLVADLGLDRVFVHEWRGKHRREELGLQTEIAMPRGCGPRDIAFHPGGKWAFVSGELDSSVHVLATGAETVALVHSLSALARESSRAGNTAAAVGVHPGGGAVYVSNRGADEISVFSFDSTSGHLRLKSAVPSGGKTPRHIALTTDGATLYVANTDSDLVARFAVEDNGLTLRPAGSIHVTAPACVVPLG